MTQRYHRPMESPDIPHAWPSALSAYANGRWHDAEAASRHVLSIDPRHAPALHLLGTLAHRAGHADDAVGLMRQAIAIEPRVAEYHSNLCVVLTTQARHDDAIDAGRRALAIDPRLVDAHYNLGNALTAAGRFDEAVPCFRDALAIRFDVPQAHNNLGNALRECGRLVDAEGAYRQALFFRPDYAHARSNLALALEDMGRADDALVEHRRAVATASNDAAIHSNLILSLHHQPDVDAEAILQECRRWNARHAEPLRAAANLPSRDRSPDRVLRIGYVSPDLRRHPVANFLLPLLEAHDRRRVHVTCYATGTKADDVTARLRAASDAWVLLAGPDPVAAERIRDDRIDLLVDLSGHTGGHRLRLFALRPAPVQVTALGHPGTTGVDAIDARWTDDRVDPHGLEPAASERPMRVASGAWCFAPLEDGPEPGELPARSRGHVTFGSFNAVKRIGGPTLDLWLRLLRDLPASRMLLKSRSFRDPEVVRRFRDVFAGGGIASSRIDLLPDEPSAFDHLRTYDRVDIALDPFPHHGTTTTCEALWMGVPVITLAGRTHASRVGASLLAAVGLSSLVAGTPAEYVGHAARLAGDLDSLAAMRAGLRERMRSSPLMDAARFARGVEAAYRALWHDWCRGADR